MAATVMVNLEYSKRFYEEKKCLLIKSSYI